MHAGNLYSEYGTQIFECRGIHTSLYVIVVFFFDFVITALGHIVKTYIQD